MDRVRVAAFAFLLAVAPFSPLHASDLQTVKISLSSSSVSDPVPFDEPFILAGSVSPQVQKLMMLVGKANGLCKKTDHPSKIPPDRCTADFSVKDQIGDVQEWTRRTAQENDFQFIIAALEPNSCYQIKFKQELAPAGEPERKDLQAQLATIVRDRIGGIARNQSSVEEENLKALQADLDAAISSFVNLHFHACAPSGVADLQAESNRAAVRAVFTATTMAKNADNDIEIRIKGIETETCTSGCSTDTLTPGPLTLPEWDAFRATLKTIIETPALLSPTSKAAWDDTVGGAKVKDLALIAEEVSLKQASLDGLLRGSLKIAGPVLVPATAVDVTSIEQLGDFFSLVRSDLFTLAPPGTFRPVFTEHFRRRSAQLVQELRVLARDLHTKTEGLNAVNASTFPDVLANRLLSQSFAVTTSPTLITEKKNPYISMDAGLGYSSRIRKGFPYAGANFYFVPVNKNAPLSRFRGTERFKKTTSILLGLTTSAFEEGRVKNFFGSGSPMLGVGYRFNQFVKINGGVIAFKLQNANPVVDTRTNELSGFVSVSIDLDVKTFLGNVGNLF